MWSHLKVLPMTYVEQYEISFIINKLCVQFMVFCHILYCYVAKSVLFGFTLFCRKIVLSRFTRYCVEKIWAKNCARGEKMTNMRYVTAVTYISQEYYPIHLAAALVVWCKKLARQFQLSCAAPHKIKFLLTFNVCKSICYTISYVISESWSQLLCSIEKAVWKLAQSVPFNRSQNVLMYFLKGMHKLCKKYPSRHRNAKLCIKKISV